MNKIVPWVVKRNQLSFLLETGKLVINIQKYDLVGKNCKMPLLVASSRNYLDQSNIEDTFGQDDKISLYSEITIDMKYVITSRSRTVDSLTSNL